MNDINETDIQFMGAEHCIRKARYEEQLKALEQKQVCHCETDLNKVAEIMKEREEKAFKYDCLVKKINQFIKDLTSRKDYDYAGTEWRESEIVDYLQELLKEVDIKEKTN